MANYDVFDITGTKVGEMTQDELDVRVDEPQTISDGLRFYLWDTDIYNDMSASLDAENLRFAKPKEDTEVSGSESGSL